MPARPEKVSFENTPNIDLVRGMHARWVISSEANDSDEVGVAIIHQDSDMADLSWDGKIDEVFFCAKGKLKVLFQDKDNTIKGEMMADEGEALFLPRGFHFKLQNTGVDSISVLIHKARLLTNHPEYSEQLKQIRQSQA
jgi:homogentisate 1,2-dioxygenase